MKKRIISILLAIAILLPFMPVNGRAEENRDSFASGDYPTITWYTIGGGMPTNWDSWTAKVNAYLEEKIGVHLNMQVIDWGSWSESHNVLVQTGADYDIMFAAGAEFINDATMGACADIETYLSEVPGLTDLIPDAYFDACRVNGVLYGIPAYVDCATANYFVWTKDIVEKYFPDYADAHTLAEIYDGLANCAANSVEVPMGLTSDGFLAIYSQKYDSFGIPDVGIGIAYEGGTEFVSVWEQADVQADLEVLNRMYNNGLINSDAPLMDTFEGMCIVGTAQGWPSAVDIWGSNRGCEVVVSQYGNIVTSTGNVSGSVLTINANSDLKLECMKLIELVNTDTKLRDLLWYGEENVNFKYVQEAGNQKVQKLNSDWTMAPYAQGTYFIATPEVGTDGYQELRDLNEQAIISPAMGFVPDTSKLMDTLVDLVSIKDKYDEIILTGSDISCVKTMMKEMRENGLDEVLAELNRQYAEWLALKEDSGMEHNVYEVLDDSDTSVVVGKSETAAIHIDAPLSDFVGVEVDGEAVAAANYTISEGSTIITFSADYLDTLSVGEHKVSVEFTDGYAYSELVISEKGPCDDGHTEETIPGKDATCTESGLTDGKKCSVCGEVLVAQEEIPALGHDFKEGYCQTCGEPDPDYEAPIDPSAPDEPEPEDPDVPTDPTDPEPEEPKLEGVIRIAGADRIGTSLQLADQLKEVLGVEKFDAVVVASALNFPDALTGSYLAAVKDAPILLTYEAAHPQIRAYVQENLKPGGMVYILGGESAVSSSFATGLTGFNVKRVAGSDRFGTNLAIMREAGVSADQPILIATALNFADSLSASAAGLPMVLVYGSLRPDQKEFLETTSKNFIIIGGEAAVSTDLENELKAIGSVERLAGSGRYQTSVMVAQKFVSNPDDVVLAYARNFPDGLCGGPLAYALGAPLILTDNHDPSEADRYVDGISAGIVVGGSGLISDASVKAIFDQ